MVKSEITVAHMLEVVDTLLKAINRIAELEAKTTWQPIETAPKDGTSFMVYCDDGSMTTCAWKDWAQDFRLVHVGTYADDGELNSNPSYWMQLPDEPKVNS